MMFCYWVYTIDKKGHNRCVQKYSDYKSALFKLRVLLALLL